MNVFKPGGFKITGQAMEIWKLPEGASVLDIGCGQGDTVEYLEKKYGYKVSGIDTSMAMIREGLARNPKLNIKCGDGEFLDDFSSFSFDGVLMECVLSLINMPDEALHEAYCVLKKGGKLFISDLCVKNPEPEFLKKLRREAKIQADMPPAEGQCASECDGECEGKNHEAGEMNDYNGAEHEKKIVDFRASGRFLMEPLIEIMKEIGYANIGWQDCSLELDNYMAEKLMNEDTMEGCFCGEGLRPNDKYKTGYFMLTAEKPL